MRFNSSHFFSSLCLIAYSLLFFLSVSLNSAEVQAANPIKKLSDIQDKLKTKIKEVTAARKKEKSLASG